MYEPYLTAVSSPSVLLPSYSSGYNLAESYAAANTMISWMGVVVGDPKMSPYADIVHDIEIIDVRILGNVSQYHDFEIEIAIQNIGPGQAIGNLKVLDKLGSVVLTNHSMTLPSGSENGSRQIIKLQLNTSREGWNNLAIRWDASSLLNPERNIDNNLFDLTLWANSAPEIEDLFCDSSQYSRGDRFVCSVEATDDSGIKNVSLAWRITSGNNSSEWIWQGTGSQDGYLWWTTIELPTDVQLGMLDLKAVATDASNISTVLVSNEIAMVRDAPAFWFGVHVSGVDDPNWGGASVLTSKPTQGVLRGYVLTLKACVLDPDHSRGLHAPIITSTRGQIDGLTYVSGSSSEHHCYIASFTLPTETSLESFKIELRTHDGDFIKQRTIPVADEPPEAELRIVDSSGNPVENVLGGGEEYIEVTVTDYDDSIDNVYGDLTVMWPGQLPYSIPIEFENGIVTLPLTTSESIDSGNLILSVNITGANGVGNSASIQTPIVLSPPEILSIDLCQEGEEIQELMFGQTADAVVRIRSSRQIYDVTATLEQLGWIVSAPSQGSMQCGNDLAEQNSVHHFRIQLDSSFIPGNGSLGVRVVDIDELVSISYLNFEFLHSPPEITVSHPSNLSHASLLEIMVEMDDADGIDATCLVNYQVNGSIIYTTPESVVSDLDGIGFWSASWLLPTNVEGNLTIDLSCKDWSDNTVNYNAQIIVDEPLECITDCAELEQETDDSSQSMVLPITIGGLVFILIVSLLISRVRAREETKTETWTNEDEAPKRDERIPEGWTLEEFLNWLDGPIPEDWEEDQWDLYRTSLEDLR